MTSLVLEALPVALALTACGVFALLCVAGLVFNFLTDNKKAARPCEGRRRDPRR